MMKRRMNEAEATEREPKRLRFDIRTVVNMMKNLMSSANAVPFLRKGRFEECEDKMYLEDILTRVEDGRHQDIDEVFNDIYKVLKTERDGNEIRLEDQEKQVYDEADALIMAGMMMKTAKSLQKEIEDSLKVVEEESIEDDDDLLLVNSEDVVQKLRRQFEAIPSNTLHDEAVKMMFADANGRKKIMEDLSGMEDVYTSKYGVVKIAEDSANYKQVSDYFEKTLGSREEGENCEIENIFEINNKYTSDNYNDALKEMERKLGEKPMERIFCHGTSDKAIASIIKNNFDVEAIPNDFGVHGEGRPKRAMYGKGIYLGNSSATALLYGNIIIVCHVIMGKCEKISFDDASVNNRNIPAEYDTRVLVNTKNIDGHICIVKETRHVLPQFVISLKNKGLSWERKRSAFIITEKRKLSTMLGRCLYENKANSFDEGLK